MHPNEATRAGVRAAAQLLVLAAALAAARAAASPPTSRPTSPPTSSPTSSPAGPTSTAAPPAPGPPAPRTREGEATFGLLLNGGNVAGAAGRLGAWGALRAGAHALRVDLGVGVAAYAVDADGDPENGFSRVEADGEVVRASPLDAINTAGALKVRYDLFVGDDDSLFVAPQALHDSAVNLRVRLRADVGWRHFFFAKAGHALAAEAGVSWSIDDAIFAVDGADTNGDGRVSVWGDETTWEQTGGVLAARVALAYDHAVREDVTFHQTLEVIPNLSFGPDLFVVGDVAAPYGPTRTEGDDRLGFGEATIVNATSALVMRFGPAVSLGVNLGVGWDNGAIARRNAMTNYDVALAVQLAVRVQ